MKRTQGLLGRGKASRDFGGPCHKDGLGSFLKTSGKQLARAGGPEEQEKEVEGEAKRGGGEGSGGVWGEARKKGRKGLTEILCGHLPARSLTVTIIGVIYLANWNPIVLFYFSGKKEKVKQENFLLSLSFLFGFEQLFQGRSSKSATSYEKNNSRRLGEWGERCSFSRVPLHKLH